MNDIFENTPPIKLTESRQIAKDTLAWTALGEFYLEYVKVQYNEQSRSAKSKAIIKVGDASGQVSCLIEGPNIALLFGLPKEKWKYIESLLTDNKELFYRRFVNGLNDSFSLNQRMFYYFCQTNQVKDLLFIKFKRGNNFRNEAGDFIHVIDIFNCNNRLLDIYLAAFSLPDDSTSELHSKKSLQLSGENKSEIDNEISELGIKINGYSIK